VLASLLILADVAYAQRASSWRVFKIADGLPDAACATVGIASPGQVFTTHLNSNSVSLLDGYTVKTIALAEGWIGRVEQSAGGQLWTATTNGLLEFRNGEWVAHRVRAIAEELRSGTRDSGKSIPLHAVRQSRVLFLLRDRLMEFNAEDPDHSRVEVIRTASQSRLGYFSSLTVTRDGGVWVGGELGLARAAGSLRELNPGSAWTEFLAPPKLNLKKFRALELDGAGGITMVADSVMGGQHAVVRFETNAWRILTFLDDKILRAWRTAEKTFWVVTSVGLFQLDALGRQASLTDEIPAQRIFDAAVEPGGAFWLATSDGLFRRASPLWQSAVDSRLRDAPIDSMAADRRGQIWFVSEGMLFGGEPEATARHPLPEGTSRIRDIFPLANGAVVLDADGTVIQFDPARGSFENVSAPGANRQLHPLGLMKDGTLCLRNAGGGEATLEIYDGQNFRPFSGPQPTGEWHLTFEFLFATRNGDLWLSGGKGVARFRDSEWQFFPLSDRNIPAVVVAFAELADGKIVAATDDKLWDFDGRNWTSSRAGFIGIKKLLNSRDGSLWVATGEGLHRLMTGTWVENDLAEGLPSSDVSHLLEDQQGRIWAGTAGGLRLFHPESDTEPPRTSIVGLSEANGRVRDGEIVALLFNSTDRWKFSRSERLLYSHRLDEQEWSGFSGSSRISFSDLPPGKHYFQARAMDRNGNVEPSPARIEFTVMVPWYREARLIVIAFAGTVVALFFAAVAFNRHRLLRRSYAEVEKQVAARTRELELAHRELLHSQKMNALGTIAAGIAHDFNNILSIIKGSAQLIEENVDQPQKIRTRLDRIKTVVQQGAGIVEAMLGFSRSSGERAVPCDLNQVVDDTLKLLGERFGRDVEVKFERGANLGEVLVPRDLVQQVLLNLIFNAAESMTEHKRIVIATREISSLPSGLVLPPARGERHLAVAVRDSGCGISSEILPRIFEPFFTTKALSTRRGTGLGLSMVYELAKKLGAGLLVESAVGQGSVFTLVLPVAPVSKDAGTTTCATTATISSP